jgi:pimeloyl-ACP methyl ester carboxylesterase
MISASFCSIPGGQGQSDKPYDPAVYTLQTLADDVVAVLDALDIERAHYWGYTLGARSGSRWPHTPWSG